MIELMLNSLGYSGPTHFPDSGPGNKNLVSGNDVIGFFGEVFPAEFITGTTVANHLGLTVGTNFDDIDSTPWLKILYRGKFLYTPKNGFRYGLSWQAIYAAGGVYGTNDTGTFPYPANAPVNQYKPLTFVENGRTWTLVPRLMKSAASDPQTPTIAAVYAEPAEFNEIYGQLTDGRLARYTMAQLGTTATTQRIWTQTTSNTAGNNNAHVRGSLTNANTTNEHPKNRADATMRWKPVLELIPD